MDKNNDLTERAQKVFDRRVGAALIDLILWVILFFVATALFGTTTTVVQNQQATAQASLSGKPFLIFMLAQLAYFVIMEWRLGGTLGKLLLGLRVINAGGGPISLKQSFIRNILRAVDAFPYFIPYLTGFIAALNSTGKQRVGDNLTKTLVISK